MGVQKFGKVGGNPSLPSLPSLPPPNPLRGLKAPPQKIKKSQ